MKDLLLSHAAVLSSQLFKGIPIDGVDQVLRCLGASVKRCAKREHIFNAGDAATRIGIVVSGSVQLEHDDVFGNRSITAVCSPGDTFGASEACAGVKGFSQSTVARGECEVILIDFSRVVTMCDNSCTFHFKMIENMLRVIASRNIDLERKLEIMSARTTRAKLGAYLSSVADRVGSPTFEIPFTRAELADYLAVDRSAMSSELGRMKRDGLLDFDRSKFTLLQAWWSEEARASFAIF